MIVAFVVLTRAVKPMQRMATVVNDVTELLLCGTKCGRHD